MIDNSELIADFEKNEQITVSMQYPSDDHLLEIYSILTKILLRMDRSYLLDTLITIIREIVLNASKANAKRIFFEENNLNIFNKDDYAKGMPDFKKIINNFDSYKETMLSSNYRTDISFKKIDDNILIKITNNIKIVPFEQERINFRLNMAKESTNFSKAYDKVFDSSEGAGLGLVLVFFLLKNAGIDFTNFNFETSENQVSVSLVIPKETQKEEVKSEIKNKIIEEVNSLPTFPEHILQLQKLCDDPKSTIDTISKQVATDPSLTADVLKIANSAGFITGKKIDNINEAIMKIGLNNLKSILTVTASKTIIESRFKKYEAIWDHCNRTAFYARNIAIDRGYQRLADYAFISGLLHDIGRIVLLSVSSDLIRLISEKLKIQRIQTANIVEELTIGISHSTIGSEIAKKWNFPDYLIEVLQFHHTPLTIDLKNRDLIYIVYLANMISNVELNVIDQSYLESRVIQELGFKDENDFKMYHKLLIEKYQRHSSSMKL